jgi:myo-inositol catabolism protein IolC
MAIGYDKPLYILPFDHRASFETGLFGWSGALTDEQTKQVAASKEVIYDAFKLALSKGVPKEHAGILVDPQFGAAILHDAVKNGYITAVPTEKSGQAEFQFEYGEQFGVQIEAFKPTFAKALVRYNPEDDEALNRRQAGRLRELSDYVHGHGRLLMFELLVPATHEQLDRFDGEQALYDQDLRPSLMIGAIKELQGAGVEPDIWKIEGLERREECVEIAAVARRDGRDGVSCILLGRGSNAEKVVDWLRKAAGVPGFIGFAVGRTTFWDPLVALRDGTVPRQQAVEDIAGRFLEWVHVFQEASRATPPSRATA